MKRIYGFGAAAILAATMLASCCDKGVETQTIKLSDEQLLTEGREDFITCEVDAQYPVLAEGSDVALKVTSEITNLLFGEEYMTMNPQDAAENYVADLVQEYRTENLELLEFVEQKEGEDVEVMATNWGDSVTGSVACVRDGVLSYVADKYAFRGGAHGMTVKTARNFCLKTGELVTEDGYFKEGWQSALTTLLTAKLPESLPEGADMDGIFVSEIEPNGNFFLSEDGVTYIYNQYEIAPYAFGVIEVTLPWSEVKGLLK